MPRDIEELKALRAQLRDVLARLDTALAQNAAVLAQNAELVELVAKLNERIAELLPVAKAQSAKETAHDTERSAAAGGARSSAARSKTAHGRP